MLHTAAEGIRLICVPDCSRSFNNVQYYSTTGIAYSAAATRAAFLRSSGDRPLRSSVICSPLPLTRIVAPSALSCSRELSVPLLRAGLRQGVGRTCQR